MGRDAWSSGTDAADLYPCSQSPVLTLRQATWSSRAASSAGWAALSTPRAAWHARGDAACWAGNARARRGLVASARACAARPVASARACARPATTCPELHGTREAGDAAGWARNARARRGRAALPAQHGSVARFARRARALRSPSLTLASLADPRFSIAAVALFS